MATAWIDSVRQRRQLTIQFGQGVAGEWRSIVESAVKNFNELSNRHALNVMFKATADQDDPANLQPDVHIVVADGHISFQSGTFSTTGRFDGTRLHGLTRFVRKGQRIERALVLLPSKPQFVDAENHRPVGQHVQKVIAVHELFHACGLDQSDHAPGDLFQSYPMIEPGEAMGSDRVCCEFKGGRRRAMPPIIINDRTITRIRQIW